MHFKLIKCDSEDIYNVTKDVFFYIHQIIQKKTFHDFHQKWSSTKFFNIDNDKKCLL